MINKITFIFLILTSFSLYSQIGNKTIDKWLNAELTHSEFIKINQQEVIKINDKDYLSAIDLSKIYMNIGLAWYRLNNKDESIKNLEIARKYAQKSLDLKETAEGWRLLADNGSYIMIQKGITYIIRNSGKVHNQALKALELDNNNPRAALINAQGLINTPKALGGNKKEGISILQELATRKDLSNEDLFYINIALTQALKSIKEIESAKSVIKKALRIYPNNTHANDLLKTL